LLLLADVPQVREGREVVSEDQSILLCRQVVYLFVLSRTCVNGYYEDHVDHEEKHRRGHPEIVSRELR
jgi:hypothetical protein